MKQAGHRWLEAARSAAVTAALLLAACAQFPTRPPIGPITDIPASVAAPATTALSATYAAESVRRDTAMRVWKLIDERFYDPKFNGVDWERARRQFVPRAEAARSDAEFYAALKAMVRSLHDSHTQVLTARETVDRRRFVSPRMGLHLGWIEQQVAIIEVEPESPAALAGLRAGDVIRAVNGTRLDAGFFRRARSTSTLADAEAADAPFDGFSEARPTGADGERERVLRAVAREVRGAAGSPPHLSPVRFMVERDGGSIAEATVAATLAPRPPSAEFRMLDGGVALIRFSRFLPEVRYAVERALQDARFARAVIIDLRGNGGGLFEFYRWFAGRFLPESREVMRSLRRESGTTEQGSGVVRAGGVGPPLLQPLAVLVDSRTASAAELTAVTLAEQRDALLVGDPTCGCVVGVRAEYVLPDGGGLRVSETGFVSARGAHMEGRPTMPAVRVVPTLADLRAGRDVVLEEAQRRLLRGLH
ncbi:MAG: S41 family peptidase [Gemmatimonadota bacterium]